MDRSERAGLLYVLAGFSMLPVGDAVVKGMAGLWTPPAIAATRFTIAAFALSSMLAVRHGKAALWPMPAVRLQGLRGLAVSIGTISFFTAVWLMPLAEATTITFMQPMI